MRFLTNLQRHKHYRTLQRLALLLRIAWQVSLALLGVKVKT
jgi:hypothetical protein